MDCASNSLAIATCVRLRGVRRFGLAFSVVGRCKTTFVLLRPKNRSPEFALGWDNSLGFRDLGDRREVTDLESFNFCIPRRNPTVQARLLHTCQGPKNLNPKP